jgi:hypothetical protein
VSALSELPDSVRAEILEDFSNIVRSAHLSSAAVAVSTPEQIVWMTADAIHENLTIYANGLPSGYRWFPQSAGVVADIRREIQGSKLPEVTKKRVDALIDRGASGWPS